MKHGTTCIPSLFGRVPDRLAQAGRIVWLPLLIVVAMLLFLLFDQRYVWGQPDLRAQVVASTAIGDTRSCGKSCQCDEARFALRLSDNGAGHLFDCVDAYDTDDTVTVRRERGQGGHVLQDPVSGVWLLPVAVGTGAAFGLFLLLYNAAGWAMRRAWTRVKEGPAQHRSRS